MSDSLWTNKIVFMAPIVVFLVSGLAIVSFFTAKAMEKRRGKVLFVTKAISRGDRITRETYHKAVTLYSEWKEKALIFFRKRIPIHSKNFLNKLLLFLEKKKQRYAENMRNSRLIKKQDGLSEFFQTMSTVEKGNGAIHDTYKEGSQNKQKELE